METIGKNDSEPRIKIFYHQVVTPWGRSNNYNIKRKYIIEMETNNFKNQVLVRNEEWSYYISEGYSVHFKMVSGIPVLGHLVASNRPTPFPIMKI